MQNTERGHKQASHIQRYTLLLLLAWSAVIAMSLAFSLYQNRQALKMRLLGEAKALYAMDIEYRNWIIGHGGVYVPVTDNTPPSPNLAHVLERDVTTPSGKTLTLLNSSYAMRQVHELMERHGAPLHGHIASLRPINPDNLADDWEAAALRQFERGATEVSTMKVMHRGEPFFRYMRPMITEASCLKCHAKYGDKLGDIRGGISVSIPVKDALFAQNREEQSLILGHGAIWALGLVGLLVGGRRQQLAVLNIEKSEAEVRLMTNAIAHAIYGQDVNGRCTFANAACLQMLGYDNEQELLGRDMHALMHHSRADGSPYPAAECPTHRSARDGKALHMDEEVLWRKDGSHFPAEYWSYPIMQDGRCLGVVATFLDISEQKRISNELKRSQRLLESIVEHVPAMIFLKDARALRFELFNRAGEDMLGYAREDLLGRNDYDFFPQEQADFFTRKDRTVLESQTMLEIPEELISTADGKQKWLHTFKIGLYDEQDRPAHLLGISMDITASKQADLKLKTSQHNLAEAQRLAHVGSWELDLVADSLHWSDEIYRIFELDRESFGASYAAFLEAIHPDDRERVNKAYTASLQDRQPYEVEHRLLMQDGRVKYVLEQCETVFDESGKPLRSTGTVQDISDRKRAEMALRESKERYDDVVKRIPVGIYLYHFFADGADRFDYVSPRFCQILGLDEAEVLRDARRAFTAAHPEDLDSLLEANSRAFAGRKPFHWEGRFMVHGETRWITIDAEPTSLPAGESQWNGVVRDVTERKQAQLALSESEEKFRTITTTANDAIVMIDNNGTVIFWNRAAEHMFGFSQDEIHGRDLHALLVPAAYQEAFKQGFARFQRDGTGAVIGHQLELTGIRKGGEEFPLELSVASTQLRGRWNAIGIIRDISERRQAEATIAHAHRALHALSTVNRELVHASNEQDLLQAICRAIVEEKDYRMAWVGYLQQDEARSIKLMASAGDENGVLAHVQPRWAEGELGLCARAVQSGQSQISRDIANDPLYQAWGHELVGQGCVSSIALPLKGNGAVFGVLHVYAAELDAFTRGEVDLLEEMGDDLAFGVMALRIRQERDRATRLNEEHLGQMHEMLHQTVLAISKAVEARDPYTAGHQRHVADLACAIAERMGLDEYRIEGIRMGATIHDIGKIQVPAEILTKPSQLTDIEYTFIKEHSRVGYEILRDIHFPWPVAEIAYQHHERLDGSGYPRGLKQDEICLEARIVAVADVVEAMSSHRPYRAGLGVEAVLEEIRKNRGTIYDAEAVDACLAVFEAGYLLQ